MSVELGVRGHIGSDGAGGRNQQSGADLHICRKQADDQQRYRRNQKQPAKAESVEPGRGKQGEKICLSQVAPHDDHCNGSVESCNIV